MLTATRTVRLMETSEGHALRIQDRRSLNYYRLTRLPSDFGTAYRLQKTVSGRECYDVCLLEGGRSTCECLGHLSSRAKKECKHIAALFALTKAGKLANIK